MVVILSIKPFHEAGLFLYSLRTFDVFKGYRQTSGIKWTNNTHHRVVHHRNAGRNSECSHSETVICFHSFSPQNH